MYLFQIVYLVLISLNGFKDSWMLNVVWKNQLFSLDKYIPFVKLAIYAFFLNLVFVQLIPYLLYLLFEIILQLICDKTNAHCMPVEKMIWLFHTMICAYMYVPIVILVNIVNTIHLKDFVQIVSHYQVNSSTNTFTDIIENLSFWLHQKLTFLILQVGSSLLFGSTSWISFLLFCVTETFVVFDFWWVFFQTQNKLKIHIFDRLIFYFIGFIVSYAFLYQQVPSSLQLSFNILSFPVLLTLAFFSSWKQIILYTKKMGVDFSFPIFGPLISYSMKITDQIIIFSKKHRFFEKSRVLL